jgi:hypothetical protein
MLNKRSDIAASQCSGCLRIDCVREKDCGFRSLTLDQLDDFPSRTSIAGEQDSIGGTLTDRIIRGHYSPERSDIPIFDQLADRNWRMIYDS